MVQMRVSGRLRRASAVAAPFRRLTPAAGLFACPPLIDRPAAWARGPRHARLVSQKIFSAKFLTMEKQKSTHETQIRNATQPRGRPPGKRARSVPQASRTRPSSFFPRQGPREAGRSALQGRSRVGNFDRAQVKAAYPGAPAPRDAAAATAPFWQQRHQRTYPWPCSRYDPPG